MMTRSIQVTRSYNEKTFRSRREGRRVIPAFYVTKMRMILVSVAAAVGRRVGELSGGDAELLSSGIEDGVETFEEGVTVCILVSP